MVIEIKKKYYNNLYDSNYTEIIIIINFKKNILCTTLFNDDKYFIIFNNN